MASRRRPNTSASLYKRALALHATKRLGEARVAYRQMLRENPVCAFALNGLGGIAEQDGEEASAALLYRRAVVADKRHFEAHFNLARLLRRFHQLDEALKVAKRAVDLKPDASMAYSLVSSIYSSGNRPELALAALQRALDLDPDNLTTRQRLNAAKRSSCDWRGFEDDDEAIRQAAASGVRVNPFSLLSTQADMAEQKACAIAWAKRLELSAEHQLPPPLARRDGKIRLGYLSGDFHNHATSYLTAELFERHDRSNFEVHGYSYGPAPAGGIRDRIQSGFDSFTDLRTLSSTGAAKAIRADGIDILVDLKGYTDRARPEILAYRPAAIQVNYLGFPSTMGASFVDYLIADTFTAPPGTEAYCTERLIRLPDCFQPNDSRREITAPAPSRKSLGLPDTGFVFCAFNAAYKFTPAMFDVWMNLLRETPGSVLWLLQQSAFQEGNLKREAAARGVSRDRLVFSAWASQKEHLARLGSADLFLDTSPVGAFTTASDALWAGLPVLTFAGKTPAGRGAGSLLHAIGLPELVTATIADYEHEALSLAREPHRLRALRERLVRNRTTTPLFDTPRFVRNLEAVYLDMMSRQADAPSP